jgi:hypothetical protein
MKEQTSLTLKKMNIRLNNIEGNTAKIIIILTTYAVAAKTNTQRDANAATITIASYNNIYQRRQLKKIKKKNNDIQNKKAAKKNRFVNSLCSKIDERL